MTSPPQPDAIVTAQALTGALNGMSQRLDAVRKDSEARDGELLAYGQQNRRILRRHRLVIWAGVILFLIDVGLTVRVSFVASDASHAAATATRAAATANQTRASNLAACEQTNAARAQNKALWDYLLAESRPAPNATAAQKAADEKLLADLNAHVNKAFTLSACQKLYGRRP